MKKHKNMHSKNTFFSTTSGIIFTGLIIGVLAATLQKLGNPGNMGICVACFERDIAGALGLHQAKVVQYLRPEIMGLGLGAFIAAIWSKDYRARGGASPIIRFILGMIAAIGALVFLGCPWRALLRLAGGDWNAILGLLGLSAGIYVATIFFKNGYNLGRSSKKPAVLGFIFPLVLLVLLVLRIVLPQINGEFQNGFIYYSVKGPGSQHAPLLVSLGCGLAVGLLAQRSRFCTMGALRDLFLFKQLHLFYGIVALIIAAFCMNIIFGQFFPGFAGQPVAHTDGLWNFIGMALAGLAFAFAGGCPGRQLFMGGEGDTDAAIFAAGLLAGASVAHIYGTASSAAGTGPNGPLAVGIGFVICLVIGFWFTFRKA